MRLWSLHPKYLDARGLGACWREALLARSVLTGKVSGYRFHPQLIRFRDADDPVRAIDAYLRAIWEEARRRGYRFDERKIGPVAPAAALDVTSGQLDYEFEHLKRKLKAREPQRYAGLLSVDSVEPNPMFRVREGGIAVWEIIH